MKTKKISFALLIILMVFNACKDTSDDETRYSVPKIKKVAHYIDDKLSSELTFQYDTHGRLIRENVSDQHYLVYTYVENKVIKKVYLLKSGETLTDTLLLNEKGLQISDYPTSAIEYDDQGYLVKRMIHINKIPNLNTFKIENDNTVQWTNRTGDRFENIMIDQTFEFLPNSTNTIGNDNYGLSFYGKQNKNLMARQTYVSYNGNDSSEFIETYKYELDVQKRVVKSSIVEDPGNYTLYTYYN